MSPAELPKGYNPDSIKTKEDVKSYLKELYDRIDKTDLCFPSFDTMLYDGDYFYNFTELPEVNVAEEIGGYEGDGEYMRRVWLISFPDDEVVFVQHEGRYDSWDESVWFEHSFQIVHPQEVTKITFKTK